MDTEDAYFEKHYPEYYKVYKYDSIAFDAFDEKVDKILCTLRKLDTSYTNVGVIESVNPGEKQPLHRKYYGLLSIDNLNGTGHWCGFVIKGGVAHVFDSMGPRGKYWPQTEFILSYKFPRIKIKRINLSPQPWGGEVPNEETAMKWALARDEKLPPFEHHILMGYNAQHRYCYMEALRFVTVMLQHGKFEENMECDPRSMLKSIKGHMSWLELPPEFFYIYDPHTDSRESIYE